MKQDGFHITSFYVFHRLEDLEGVERRLEARAQELQLRGLVILAPEGMNATLSAPTEAQRLELQNWLKSEWPQASWQFKDSQAETQPFRRFTVKVRDEIVTLQRPELFPEGPHHHLKPHEWDQVLRHEKVTLLDTRNDYETELGTFRGALVPPISKFQDFSAYLEKAEIPKDEKILIFCTGGIRCEKAILEMNRQGYKNVWQLEGGILQYFADTKAEFYEGECFVFDHRVAVDKNLKPTGRSFCPHCGQPADMTINCVQCAKNAKICHRCHEKSTHGDTCSKNCAHHLLRRSGKSAQKI